MRFINTFAIHSGKILGFLVVAVPFFLLMDWLSGGAWTNTLISTTPTSMQILVAAFVGAYLGSEVVTT